MKKRKIILAARDDGFGERMCCLLNAMYISKKTSLKFCFTWKEKKDSLVKAYTNTKCYLVCNDQINKEEIFSRRFIKKYHCDEFDVSPRDKFYLFCNRSILDIGKRPYEYSWGWRSCQANLTSIFNDVKWKEYQKILNQCWRDIEFSNGFKTVACKAQEIANELGNYIAIHIRSGDLIFESIGYSRWIWFAANKALSFHLALRVILQEIQKNHVVIFTDDIESAQCVVDYIKLNQNSKYQCIMAYQLYTDCNDNSNQRVFFEIVLMSYARKIYSSGDSGFSRLASFIGKSNIVNTYKLFNLSQQINYISHGLKELKLNKYQMSYSYFMLYFRSKEKGLSVEKQLYYLQEGYKWNTENYIFPLCQLDIYLNLGSFEKVELILSEIFNRHFQVFFDFLMIKSYDLKHYNNVDLFPAYLKYKGDKYKNILLVQYMLASDMLSNINILGGGYNYYQIELLKRLDNQEFVRKMELYLKILDKHCIFSQKYDLLFIMKYNLSARFFGRLDYIIGKKITSRKSMMEVLRLPFEIYRSIQDYKKTLNQYKTQRRKDRTIALPALKNYDNYEMVYKLKGHLSYKIGRVVITCLKSKYKLRFLIIWLDFIRAYWQFLKRR